MMVLALWLNVPLVLCLWPRSASAVIRNFENPVIPDYYVSQPGAIVENGTYYIVKGLLFQAKNYDDGEGGPKVKGLPRNIFEIFSSSDLKTWTYVSNAFDEDQNLEEDSDLDSDRISSPEIHRHDKTFLLYYSAATTTDVGLNVSLRVATATSVTGPYARQKHHLLEDTLIYDDENIPYISYDPAVISDNGKSAPYSQSVLHNVHILMGGSKGKGGGAWPPHFPPPPQRSKAWPPKDDAKKKLSLYP